MHGALLPRPLYFIAWCLGTTRRVLLSQAIPSTGFHLRLITSQTCIPCCLPSRTATSCYSFISDKWCTNCQYNKRPYLRIVVVVVIIIIINFKVGHHGLFWFRILTSETYEYRFGHLVGLLGRGSARHKASTYKGQHNTEKRGHTLMPRVGFEPTIPVFERSKAVRASDQTTILSKVSDIFVNTSL